jgi:hypothetical protein
MFGVCQTGEKALNFKILDLIARDCREFGGAVLNRV